MNTWKSLVTGDYLPAFYGSPQVVFKGGGGVPPPPDPMREAEAQLKIKAYEGEQQRLREAREDKAKAAKDLADRARFQTGLTNAISGAQQYGNSRLNSLGITDDYGIMSAFENELNSARGRVPDLSNDIGSVINPSTLFTTAYEGQRGLQRRRLNNEAQDFMGEGFERKLFADEADDSILDAILGDQTTEAQSALDRAKARGQLNDTGYGYGVKALGTQKAAARSKLEDMGLGVLERYRTGLSSTADNYRNRINNYDFGDNLSLDAIRGDLDTEANRYRGRMEGDVRGAVGDTELYDLDLLLGKAGNYQGTTGATPTTGGSLAQAFSTRTPEEEERLRRAGGNVGVF